MRKVLNNKVLLLVVAVLLLANIAMLLYFLWGKEPSRKNAHAERQRSPITLFLEQQIGFDKQQMEAYEKMRQEHRQKMRPLFEEIRIAKVGFYGLLNNPAYSESEFNQGASAIGEKQKAIDVQAFHNFRELRKICTPSQQVKYDSLIPGVIGEMWFPARRANSHQRDSLGAGHK
jgi:hypothetical protein